MKKEKEVEMIDIWMPVEKEDNMKLVVRIVNGYPLVLDKDWVLEKRILTEKEAENLFTSYKIKNKQP